MSALSRPDDEDDDDDDDDEWRGGGRGKVTRAVDRLQVFVLLASGDLQSAFFVHVRL